MKSSNKINTSLLIQLIVLIIIAIIGILYIIEETPIESLERYDEAPRVAPFGASERDNFFSPRGSGDNDGDDVSLSGKEGRYEEALIGK